MENNKHYLSCMGHHIEFELKDDMNHLDQQDLRQIILMFEYMVLQNLKHKVNKRFAKLLKELKKDDCNDEGLNKCREDYKKHATKIMDEMKNKPIPNDIKKKIRNENDWKTNFIDGYTEKFFFALY